MHDGRVKLFLDQFILSKSLFGNCELRSNVSGALAVQTLKFVVLCAEHLLFLAAGFIFNLELLDLDQVLLVHVHDSLEFITLAKDCKLEATDFLIALLLQLPQFNQELVIRGRFVPEILL
jgi:hypothetical protein